MSERQKQIMLIALAVIALAIVLIQMTPLAFLPPKANDFVGGFAFGICLALAIVWLSNRFGAVKK